MKATFKKTDKNLIIEIPLKQKVWDYFGEKVIGEMDNICGLITTDKDNNDICGFAHLIDRSYKGKDPDISPIFYEYWGEKKEFEELCKELKLGIVYI